MKYKIKINGYVYLHEPNHPHANCNGYVAEHRFLMEEEIERYLTKNEVVHHINGIVDDNRIENFKLMTGFNHRSFHKTGSKHKEESKQKTKETMRKRWQEGKFKERVLPDVSGENNPMYGRKPTQKQIEQGKKLGGWNKGLKMPKLSESVKKRKRDKRGRFV